MPRPALSVHQDQRHLYTETSTIHMLRPGPSVHRDQQHPYAKTSTHLYKEAVPGHSIPSLAPWKVRLSHPRAAPEPPKKTNIPPPFCSTGLGLQREQHQPQTCTTAPRAFFCPHNTMISAWHNQAGSRPSSSHHTTITHCSHRWSPRRSIQALWEDG